VLDKYCKTGANDEEESVLGTGETQTRNLGQGEFIIVSLLVIIKDFLKDHVRLENIKEGEIKENAEV